MSRRFTIQPAAAGDLSRHLAWLNREADRRTAERFLDAVETSFAALAETPGLGSLVPSRNQKLVQARKWRIKGFTKYLIFYTPNQGGGIVVVRVLHGAQDWLAILENE